MSFCRREWSHHNPIDILGDASSDRYAKTLEVVAPDPNSDGLLVILTPQAITNPTQTAEKLKSYSQLRKPLLASWMGGVEVSAGTQILNQANIPTFPYPDTAVRLFNYYMWRYTYNLRAIYETPSLSADCDVWCPDRSAANIVTAARKNDRRLLTEFDIHPDLKVRGFPNLTI